jgi:hypothetical protein
MIWCRDKSVHGQLQIILRITWVKAIVFPLSGSIYCQRVCVTQRLSAALLAPKSHKLQVTSCNILTNSGPLPSYLPPHYRTWMNAAHLWVFPETRHTQIHQAAQSPTGVLELSWEGRQVFLQSHAGCSFQAAMWHDTVICKECCGSLEEGVWPAPDM